MAMRLVGLLAATAALVIVVPAQAARRGSKGGTVAGAMHAVVHAVAEEGGSAVYEETPQVRCRHTTPSRFGCSFYNLTRRLAGRVSVSYSHHHYYVGEPVYEPPPEYVPVPPICSLTPGC
jgi:hypothetical protein